MIYGIDISRWQRAMDFSLARREGLDFCYIKASEGGKYQDPCLPVFQREARAHQLLAGAYHYFHPTASPAAQLENFCAAAAGLEWDLPPAVDVEEHDGCPADQVTSCLQRLVKLYRQRFGRWPLVYTSPGFWNKHLLPWSGWAGLPLWVAHWGVVQPWLPRDWRLAGASWTVWQYSGRGNRQGARYGAASRDIDLDCFCAGRAEMVAWGMAEPAARPAPAGRRPPAAPGPRPPAGPAGERRREPWERRP